MPEVRVGDIDVYYEEQGQGEPLVLIMGLGANLDWWGEEFRSELARTRKVIAFDNRGAGRTDAPEAPYCIRQFAADTVGLMDALGVDRADVMGVSMGGMIADRIPEARLVLLEGLAHGMHVQDMQGTLGPIEEFLSA